MIKIDGPFDAREEGGCNACGSQRDRDGTRFGTVYMLRVGITTTRMCPRCLWVLFGQLRMLLGDVPVSSVTLANASHISIDYSGPFIAGDE